MLISNMGEFVTKNADDFVFGFHLIKQAGIKENWSAGKSKSVDFFRVNYIECVYKWLIFAFFRGDLGNDECSESPQLFYSRIRIWQNLFFLPNLSSSLLTKVYLLLHARAERVCA